MLRVCKSSGKKIFFFKDKISLLEAKLYLKIKSQVVIIKKEKEAAIFHSVRVISLTWKS